MSRSSSIVCLSRLACKGNRSVPGEAYVASIICRGAPAYLFPRLRKYVRSRHGALASTCPSLQMSSSHSFSVCCVQKMHSSLTNPWAKLAYSAALLLMAAIYILSFKPHRSFGFRKLTPYTLVYYQLCATLTNTKPICNKCALQFYRFALRAFNEDVKHCPRRTIPIQARSLT